MWTNLQKCFEDFNPNLCNKNINNTLFELT